MKRIFTPAALLLCIALLSACADKNESSAPVTTASVSDSAVTTELTTELTTSASETASGTEAAGSNPAEQTADTAQTESMAAASDSTAAASATSASGTTASSASETQKQPTAAEKLFDSAAPGMDCSAYISANKGYTLQKDASCIGSGEDRVYTYPDYIIRSYYEGGKDTVQEIELTGKGVSTRDGISVGMKAADIEKVYGAPAIPGEYIYTCNDGVIDFLLNADKTIKSISIYPEDDPA